MTALLLATVIALSSGAAPELEAATASGCTQWSGWSTPPATIAVFRIHRRGSSIPARVETWSFKRYVGSVMASGAWSGRVTESAKVGALVIRQWAEWMIAHHQRGYSWRGRCYDVTDSDQFIRGDRRPWSHVPVRTMAAVRAMWHVSLTKHGRHWRTGWSGGWIDDGWRVGEDSTRAMAERGYGWRTIIRRFLSPVRIVE